MTREYIIAFESMGYRKMSDDVYGKPISNTLITYEWKTRKLSQRFVANNDTKCIWDSSPILENIVRVEDIIQEIADFEKYQVKVNIGCKGKPTAFLTGEQQANIYCGVYDPLDNEFQPCKE